MQALILFLALGSDPDADARAALALSAAASVPHRHDETNEGERIASPAIYEWRRYADADDQIALYKDGVQVGAYNFAFGYYRPLLYEVQGTGYKVPKWGDKCSPPAEVPPREY